MWGRQSWSLDPALRPAGGGGGVKVDAAMQLTTSRDSSRREVVALGCEVNNGQQPREHREERRRIAVARAGRARGVSGPCVGSGDAADSGGWVENGCGTSHAPVTTGRCTSTVPYPVRDMDNGYRSSGAGLGWRRPLRPLFPPSQPPEAATSQGRDPTDSDVWWAAASQHEVRPGMGLALQLRIAWARSPQPATMRYGRSVDSFDGLGSSVLARTCPVTGAVDHEQVGHCT